MPDRFQSPTGAFALRKCASTEGWRSCGRDHRGSTLGAAGGGRGDADDDDATGAAILGGAGFCCGMGAACDAEAENGGINNIFCLISSSTACRTAIFWAIWSCLAESWSTLSRTASRLDAKGSICWVWLVEVLAAIGDFVADIDINQASVGARSTSISPATSP